MPIAGVFIALGAIKFIVNFLQKDKMKDTQLRGIVLAKYYESRRGHAFTPESSDFDPPIEMETILSISDQLGEHGLIKWEAIKFLDGTATGFGKITAFGIDVVEGEATPDIKVEFVQNKTVNISGSSNVIVGDSNTLSITNHIEALSKVINDSNSTEIEKAEAKGLLRKFL